MILSYEVKQIVSYKTVGSELEDRLDIIQNEWHGKVLNVIETKVPNGMGCSNQGFIIIYEIPEKSIANGIPLDDIECGLIKKIEQLPTQEDDEGQDRYLAYDVLKTIKEYYEWCKEDS